MPDPLSTEVDRLIAQVAHWEHPRWTAPLPPGDTRADRVHGLAQRLADRGAGAEKRPARPLPRLGDQGLIDQVRVCAADLVLAGASDLDEAAADVRDVRLSL